jgi:hypothetical protein
LNGTAAGGKQTTLRYLWGGFEKLLYVTSFFTKRGKILAKAHSWASVQKSRSARPQRAGLGKPAAGRYNDHRILTAENLTTTAVHVVHALQTVQDRRGPYAALM